MDLRRGSRVSSRFSVAIEGLEDRLRLRRGDLSATGIYFETDRGEVGAPGTVHWLRIGPPHAAGAHAEGASAPTDSLRVMACVVRVASVAEAAGSLHGVAFEFMPDSDVAAVALVRFVRTLLETKSPGPPPSLRTAVPTLRRVGPARLSRPPPSEAAGSVAPPALASVAPPPEPPSALAAPAPSSPDETATLRQLSVRSMVLETSWALDPGEAVRVDIVAPGMTRRIRLDGRAVRVVPRAGVPGAPRYDIELEIEEEKAKPLRRLSSAVFEALTPDAIARALEARAAARAEGSGAAPPPSEPAPASRGRAPGSSGAGSGAVIEGDPSVDAGALDDLLAALILPPPDATRRATHLQGALERVQFPTLCSIFEMERLTGRLDLHGPGGQAVTLWVRDGAFVDAEPLAPGEVPRACLARVLAWTAGTFAFEVEPVGRVDRVQTRMTALLLDLARARDEAAREP